MEDSAVEPIGLIAKTGPASLVESRGIEHIPDAERWGRPSRLFGMWAGTNFNVEFVVYGTLAVAIFGLSFAQALVIILVGNCFYVITGLASLQGPAAGTTALTVSRAPFGPKGNRGPSLFNWVTQVGFEIEGIALIVIVAVAMFAKGGITADVPLRLALIVAAVGIQALLPLVGHAAMLKVLRWLSVPFIALFVVMAAITVGKVNLHAASHGAGWGSMMVFLALVISVGGLGWSENASDYSRYLPANTSKRRIVAAVGFGGAIPSILLEVLGAGVATAVAPAHAGGLASVTGMVAVFPAWFIWPYFVMAIVQLFAINSVDLYSSGVTLQSLGIKLKRWHCVLLDTVVCGAFAGYAVFSGRFSQLLADFILFIIVWLAPWFAIYFLDYLMRGGKYDPNALMNEKGGLYFRGSGYHWPAIIAQAVGMVAAFAWLNAYSPYVSWLSTHVGGSDFSIFMGFIFGGGTYYLLARKSVGAEGRRTPKPVARVLDLSDGPVIVIDRPAHLAK